MVLLTQVINPNIIIKLWLKLTVLIYILIFNKIFVCLHDEMPWKFIITIIFIILLKLN